MASDDPRLPKWAQEAFARAEASAAEDSKRLDSNEADANFLRHT